MIVLDATNKVLEIIGSGTGLEVVVSYWSIDSSNVWTPHSFEVEVVQNVTTTILPAPSAGETKVVENIWILVESSMTSVLKVTMKSGTVALDIAHISGSVQAVPPNTVLTLSRDGTFNRQVSVFAGIPTTQTQNVH